MHLLLNVVNGLVGIVVGIGMAVSALLGGISHAAISVLPHHTSLIATTTPADFPAATSTTKSVGAKPKPPANFLGGDAPDSQSESGVEENLPAVSVQPTLSSAELNSQTRAALVNIECTTIAGGSFEPISGSGVIIDSDGVILTNAHVGQFFLLRDYDEKNNVQCTVRTGSPAQSTYTAELLYLPPAWIAQNASQIVAQEPSGDGQNDFALLHITGTTNGSPFDGNLPDLALSTASPDIGTSMLLAAYPAGFLSGQLIATQLYASSAFAYVTQLLSYATSTSSPLYVDLFSVGGSIESQQGSSGGAVVNQDGTLAGIIDTDTTAASTGERDLRAITVDYINRQLQIQGYGGFIGLLSRDLDKQSADFNATVAPQETQQLESVLDKYYGS